MKTTEEIVDELEKLECFAIDKTTTIEDAIAIEDVIGHIIQLQKNCDELTAGYEKACKELEEVAPDITIESAIAFLDEKIDEFDGLMDIVISTHDHPELHVKFGSHVLVYSLSNIDSLNDFFNAVSVSNENLLNVKEGAE